MFFDAKKWARLTWACSDIRQGRSEIEIAKDVLLAMARSFADEARK